uniref:Fcf2 pre-rRNA processing C-terminal domain-containing protein n=1 Tax=Clastoptera arizonana TaxID=38151 RepID=A0A1B6CDP6_9HEMI
MKKQSFDWNDVSIDFTNPCCKNKINNHFTEVEELMKKSVIIPGFEKLEKIPNGNISNKILRKERQKERAKTKGSDWFNLPATQITPEIENDLKVIQMRSALDNKHFYKKNDMKVLPKYFQIGKVVDSPVDFYHDRIPKKRT